MENALGASADSTSASTGSSSSSVVEVTRLAVSANDPGDPVYSLTRTKCWPSPVNTATSASPEPVESIEELVPLGSTTSNTRSRSGSMGVTVTSTSLPAGTLTAKAAGTSADLTSASTASSNDSVS